MVTSGLFQIKGTVIVKNSVLYPDYFKPKSYWENGEIVYNREGKGYISFGTKYLSYRIYPNDDATQIPYENIRKIELEDEIKTISDSKFLWNRESDQKMLSSGNKGIKSIVTTKNFGYDSSLHKATKQISNVYLFFGYEYLTVKTLSEYSPGNILLSENKFHYSQLKSIEFEDEIIDDNELYRRYLSKLHKLELERKKSEEKFEKILNSKKSVYMEHLLRGFSFGSPSPSIKTPSTSDSRHNHYCSLCKKTFKTKEGLDKHIYNVHINEGE